MDEHYAIPYLREIVVFLIAAGIVVPIFHRLRVSPVLGYLMVGAVIGPYGLGVFADQLGWLSYAVIDDLEGVQTLAELGIIFLLFVIGLELSLERLWAMRRLVFGLGALQVVLSSTVIGLIAWEFGNSPQASIVLGACLALSSTAIVMQLLIERRQLATPLGRSSFSILLFQDLAVVPILFLLGVLGAQAEAGVGWALVLALGRAVLVIVGIYLVGRLVLRPLFHLVSLTRTAEMFMAAILLVVIGTATITGVAGLSMALGAFLAGLLLAETEYRHEIEVDIEPFKGLLLGLFFMSVGMGIDYRVVGDQVFWIFASVLGLFALKSVITGALCLLFGLPRHVSLETGLLLGQGGEFAFVVVGLAMSLGLVPPDVGQFMLIVAGLSMIATPLVAATGQRFAATLESRSDDQEGSLDALGALENHVIIAGFGRVGQMIARLLDRETVSFIALDTDAITVAEQRKSGLPVYYGDASRLEMLRRAHADRAAALVLTMNDPNANEHVVRVVRKEWSDLPMFARARDTVHATRLLQHGATDVVPEAVEATLQLGMRVLQSLGTSDEVCTKRIEAERIAALAGLKG